MLGQRNHGEGPRRRWWRKGLRNVLNSGCDCSSVISHVTQQISSITVLLLSCYGHRLEGALKRPTASCTDFNEPTYLDGP